MRWITRNFIAILTTVQYTLAENFFAMKVQGDESYSIMTTVKKCKIYFGRDKTVLYRIGKIWKMGKLNTQLQDNHKCDEDLEADKLFNGGRNSNCTCWNEVVQEKSSPHRVNVTLEKLKKCEEKKNFKLKGCESRSFDTELKCQDFGRKQFWSSGGNDTLFISYMRDSKEGL